MPQLGTHQFIFLQLVLPGLHRQLVEYGSGLFSHLHSRDANTDLHANVHADPHLYSDVHANCDVHTDADANINPNLNADMDGNANVHANADQYTNTYCDAHCLGITDAES